MVALVVDDEVLVRRSISRVLRQKKISVFEGENGNEGFTLWQQNKPDLVFLDVLMPGRTGPEILEDISQVFKDHCAFVALMSAFTGEYKPDVLRKMGVDLFIAKPFDNVFDVVDSVIKGFLTRFGKVGT